MEFTVAHIITENAHDSEAWVYITYSGDKEVFDKKRCRNRAEALAFVKCAYPNSDISTRARF